METDYAIVANNPQDEFCDIRFCDSRKDGVQEAVERERVLDWMAKRGIGNRQLADLLEITEDKVSKSLTDKGKRRRWQEPELLRLVELMNRDDILVRAEVCGTGMTPEQVREARGTLANAKPIPLVGTAAGGAWAETDDIEMTELRMADVLDYLARPAGLAEDGEAYAVEIVGDSMAPRYEPGERAFVSPRATVRPGDDVIVQLVDPNGSSDLADAVTEVLIKRFLRRTANFVELRQFNPPRDFQVSLDRIAIQPNGRPAIHRVQGRP